MVWANGPQKAADLLMMLALADNCDDFGACFPGVERLAAKCRVGAKAARSTLHRLRDDGWLQILEDGGIQTGHGRNRTNLYQLNLERLATSRPQEVGAESDLPSTSERPPVDVPTDLPSTGGKPSVEPSVEPSETSSSSAEPTTVSYFDAFWAIYPRKVGKAAARKAFAKALGLVPPDEIQYGVQRLADDPNLPPTEFIPHPATWLNRGGWDDEPYPTRLRTKAEEEREIFGAGHAERVAAQAAYDAKILAQRAAAGR